MWTYISILFLLSKRHDLHVSKQRDCTTITCDINQLNATLHPDNQMHLSDTNGISLPKCGDRCCPLGYTCNGNMCTKDTTKPPISASPTSTPRPTSSSTNPASASQTSNCPAPATASIQPSFDGKSFAAGLFPGIVIGALGTLALIWLIRKRRESQSKPRYSGDFGHVARQISDPIYDPSLLAARTDFMRRGSSSIQPSPNSTDRILQGMQETPRNTVIHGLTPRIKSMWDRTPKLNFGFSNNTTTTNKTGLPATPAPRHPYHNAPAIRAGNPKSDPYATPAQKPKRIHSSPRRTPSSSTTGTRRTLLTPTHHNQTRSDPNRLHSTETIDVLMPAPGFLDPPRFPHTARHHRDTSDTTFTKLMERAGFDEQGRGEVRAWGGTRL
ncbi:hypothetical protein LEMA_P077400.1 [Plenodomus lingam JN3]|uniref:Uncharacterized protein n=1 Tax=Leptosphaeria maculans (strain JN3 / isolate v23.1.3 / race Av1-4-5-6-7-8) TaxID=985895 RepID=E5A4F6_LEPMJ|nr:hypothetical protein LEMA_P077400.1 [Plenodomus lingam JN3]CBX98501.1 hypothetical protein LEMA_P077400.1 [Plenodomus lingam JN3]